MQKKGRREGDDLAQRHPPVQKKAKVDKATLKADHGGEDEQDIVTAKSNSNNNNNNDNDLTSAVCTKKPTNTTMPTTYSFPPLRNLDDTAVARTGVDEVGSENSDLKIVCYNVAGLTAALKKGFLDYVRAEDPDILCLSETKLAQEPKDGILRDLYPFQLSVQRMI